MIVQNPEYFLAIVQYANLTKAANALYVSQTSLSQYLKRLEAELGVSLFDRSSSPLALTDAGERYYRYVIECRQRESNMREELMDIRLESRGALRLGIAVWRSACLIPDVFPEYSRRYPGVELEVKEGRFVQLKQAVSNNELDFAIVNLLPAGNYGDFAIEPIAHERILLAAPSDHPYVQQALQRQAGGKGLPVIDFDVLNHIPLVLTKPGQSLTDMVDSTLAQKHITPHMLMETGNLTTAINLAARGMCCAFVPEEGARVCQHPGKVTYFSFDDPAFSWTLAAIHKKGAYLSAFKRAFIDCAREMLNAGDSVGCS